MSWLPDRNIHPPSPEFLSSQCSGIGQLKLRDSGSSMQSHGHQTHAAEAKSIAIDPADSNECDRLGNDKPNSGMHESDSYWMLQLEGSGNSQERSDSLTTMLLVRISTLHRENLSSQGSRGLAGCDCASNAYHGVPVLSAALPRGVSCGVVILSPYGMSS